MVGKNLRNYRLSFFSSVVDQRWNHKINYDSELCKRDGMSVCLKSCNAYCFEKHERLDQLLCRAKMDKKLLLCNGVFSVTAAKQSALLAT